MKGVVLITGDETLRKEAAIYFSSLGYGFSNELPVERVPGWALVADLGMLAPLAAGLPNQDLGKIFGQVVALSTNGGFHARVQAVRVGASGFLERPVSAEEVCDLLEDCAPVSSDDPLRVLIVDDDPIVARLTGRQLELAGMRVMAVEDATTALEAIREFLPDLAIVDLYMPQCEGTELAQVIRQLRQFEALPIVFLSSEGELAAQMTAVSAGGDDFVAKGTPAALMIPLIRSRATRMRNLVRGRQLDAMTRLQPHNAFKQSLCDALDAASRGDRPVSLALLDLDNFRAVNDRHGSAVGDRVIKTLARLLRKRLRPGDVAGRLSGQQFAVMMPQTDGVGAAELVEAWRQMFADLNHRGGDVTFRLSFSAGVVQGKPGECCEDAIQRARALVRQAKDLGRNRIAVS